LIDSLSTESFDDIHPGLAERLASRRNVNDRYEPNLIAEPVDTLALGIRLDDRANDTAMCLEENLTEGQSR